jgi:hypothetical protein
MKLVILEDSRKSLVDLRKNVNGWLEKAVKATGELEALRAKEEAMNAKIAAGEVGLAYDDVKLISNLETLRAQIGVLRKQIARIEEDLFPHLEELKTRMTTVHETLAVALEPAWRQMVFDVARTLHPYFGDWGLVRTAGLRNAACQRNQPLLHATSLWVWLRGYGRGPSCGQHAGCLA